MLFRDSLHVPQGLKYEEPVFAWIPSIAATQVIQVNGFEKQWNGDLLIGSLAGQSLYHVRLAENRVLFVEPIPIGARIRDLAQVGETFYLLIDDGSLIEVRRH